MRVTVSTVLGLFAAGNTNEEILEAYPYLELDDIREALAYAAWRAQEHELPIPADAIPAALPNGPVRVLASMRFNDLEQPIRRKAREHE